MLAGTNLHLSYCTNIHPGETWPEVFKTLEEYIIPIKEEIAPSEPFGIGLRLSDYAAKQLLEGTNIEDFKTWLQSNNLYVFTMNGFPFGQFHRNRVKDDVHKPDWVTIERLNYTQNLIKILAFLLPDGIEGGISTSPLSYKPWFKNEPQEQEMVFQQSTRNLLTVVEMLIKIKNETGKIIHIDIEPEPDGLLENTGEVIEFYKNRLIPAGIKSLFKIFGYQHKDAETAIKQHIQVCYDVCHFAVAFEKAEDAISSFQREGIRIGKIQISAALKAKMPTNEEEIKILREKFTPFVESTYLHQVVALDEDGNLTQYQDLPLALENIDKPGAREWRMHFHVPIFMDQYGQLESTQDEIIEVLNIAVRESLTNHLEVETYTWEVLPQEDRLNLHQSIKRELEWVKMELKNIRQY